MPSVIQVGAEWFEELEADFKTDWFRSIRNTVTESYAKGKIRPEPANIFRALRETQPSNVKVVILGQDPYPGGGHADGLAFSSQQKDIPKSLQVIYDDLERVYFTKPKTGDLTPWAKQGVLLLNTSLSVINGIPMSHAFIGWDKLINRILDVLSKRTGIVYVAWGVPAKAVLARTNIDPNKNLVITGHHPIASVYSKGSLVFYGGFKEANKYLEEQGKEPIRWV